MTRSFPGAPHSGLSPWPFHCHRTCLDSGSPLSLSRTLSNTWRTNARPGTPSESRGWIAKDTASRPGRTTGRGRESTHAFVRQRLMYWYILWLTDRYVSVKW